MKKILSILLAGLLLLAFPLTGWAQSDPTEIPERLVIGTATQLSGHFFTDMWGNNTADMDIRTLLHTYSTVTWMEYGNYEMDPSVVVDAVATQDETGNRTYRITLHEDMTYNDGTPITAKDYVFSVLMQASIEFVDLASATSAMRHLVGYDSFSEGKPFLGVRLLEDYAFSITVAAEYLPYFYELIYVDINPYPIHVIAPGCDVADDGRGAYIVGEYTSELLQETILNPDTGYLYMPVVTTGPYMLTGYSTTSHVATFQLNPYYKGNFEGRKPTVPFLTVKQVDQDTMFNELAAGEVDILNKVTSGLRINEGMGYVTEGAARMSSYLRSGFSFLSFACEMGPTQSANVRKAVAMCVDSTSLTQNFLLGYGMPVYGYYGYGQWMAAENQEMLLELAQYELNLNAAAELLTQDGWTLNADGTPYNAAQGGVRYRMNDEGELEELYIRWASPKAANLTPTLEAMLRENMTSIGFRLENEVIEFSQLLKHYYRQEERKYHMFSLSTNFNNIFDPYLAMHPGEEFQGVYNTTGIADEELHQSIYDMNDTSPDDAEGYVQKWFNFQSRWAQLLPMVPLYSNVYYDFYRPDMYGYYANAHVSWATAILYVEFGEEPIDEIGDLDFDELQDESDDLEFVG